MSQSLVILAAGIGSRFGGLKQIEPVGPSGEFIIDYAIHDAVRAGIDKIIFVIRKAIESDFKEAIGDRAVLIAQRACDGEREVSIAYAFQEISDVPEGIEVPAGREKPWGTGHAVLAARETVDEAFIVINADDFYGAGAYEALVRYLGESAADETRHAMVAYILRNTLSEHGRVCRGVCEVGPDGCLESVEELTNITQGPDGLRNDDRVLTGNELVSMNCWGFKRSFMQALEDAFAEFLSRTGDREHAEFFVPYVANNLILDEQASFRVLDTTAKWAGVTYPAECDDVARHIQELVDEGEYPACLWE